MSTFTITDEYLCVNRLVFQKTAGSSVSETNDVNQGVALTHVLYIPGNACFFLDRVMREKNFHPSSSSRATFGTYMRWIIIVPSVTS